MDRFPPRFRGAVRLLAVVGVLGSYLTGIAQGQEPVFRPGTPIRLMAPCPEAPAVAGPFAGCRYQGTLVGLPADSLTIAGAHGTIHLDHRGVTQLEISRGRSQWLPGAGVGFLPGAGITYLVLHQGGSTSLCDRSANQDAMSRGACGGLTVLGGLAGAGLGAIVGGRFRSERWQVVPVERLRVSLVPRRGVAVGLVMSF
ncbi:MAG: hypothetical protein ACKVZ0_05590 [Gemmatimonadales bacterium]